MKRLAIVLSVVSLTLSLAACGDSGPAPEEDIPDAMTGDEDVPDEEVDDTGDQPDIDSTGDDEEVDDTGPDIPPVEGELDFWFAGAAGMIGVGESEVTLYPNDEPANFATDAYPGFQIGIDVETMGVDNFQTVTLKVAGAIVNSQPIIVSGDTGQTSFIGVTLPELADPFDVSVETVANDGEALVASKTVTLQTASTAGCEVAIAPDTASCLLDGDADTPGFQAMFTVSVTGDCDTVDVSATIGGNQVDAASADVVDGTADVWLLLADEASPLENVAVQVVATANHPESEGLDGEASVVYTADNAPPSLVITKPDLALVPQLTLAQDKDDDPSNGIQFDVWGTVTGLTELDADSVDLLIDGGVVASATPKTGVVTFEDVTFTQNGAVKIGLVGTDACGNSGSDEVQIDVFASAATIEIVDPIDSTTLLSKGDGDAGSPTIYETTFTIAADGAVDGVELLIQCRQNTVSAQTYVDLEDTAVVGEDEPNADGHYEIPVALDIELFTQQIACRVVAVGPNQTTSPEIGLTVALPAPSMSLDAPAEGAMLNSKTVTFEGEAAQLDGRPIGVDVFQGGNQLCTAAGGSIDQGVFSIPLDLSAACGGLADGSYFLQVDAIDQYGNVVSENGGLISRNVTFDTVAPGLQRLAPAGTTLDPVANPGTDLDESAGTFGYQKTLTYELTGETTAAGAEICLALNGGAPSCQAVDPGNFTATWPQVTLNPGDNTVYVTGEDAFGNPATPLSETITLILDAPVVKIVDPPGATVTAASSINVMVEVTDFETGAGIEGAAVKLFVDGLDSGIAAVDLGAGSYRFGSVPLPAGSQVELQAVAQFSGQEGASGFTSVTQKDTLPSIQITSPATGAPVSYNLASPECAGSQADCVLDVVVATTDAEVGSAVSLSVDCDGTVTELEATLGDDPSVTFSSVSLTHGTTCTVTPSVTDLAAQSASGAAFVASIDRVAPVLAKFLSPAGDQLLSQHDLLPGTDGMQHPLTVRVAGLEAGQQLSVTLEWTDEELGAQQTVISTTIEADIAESTEVPISLSDDESGTVTYPEGTVTLTANASDAAGNSASVATVVLVESDAPSVRLTKPSYLAGTSCGPLTPCATGTCHQGSCWTTWGALDSKQVGVAVAGVITTSQNLRICSDMPGTAGSGTPCAQDGYFQLTMLDTGEGQVFLDVEGLLTPGFQTLTAEIMPEPDSEWTSSIEEPDPAFQKRQVVLDVEAPSVTSITSPSDTLPPTGVLNIAEQSAPGRNYLLTIDVTEDGLAEIFVNGSKRKEIDITGLTATTQVQLDEGSNDIFVVVTDTAGNASPMAGGAEAVVELAVTVDTVEPTLVFTNPTSSPVLDGSPLDVTLSSSKDGGQVTLSDGGSVIGTEVVSGGVATFADAVYGVLSDGSHTLTATVIGPNGNQASAATEPATIVVDTSPPTAAITTPAHGSTFTSDDDAEPDTPGYQLDVEFDVGDGATSWNLWIASSCDGSYGNCGAPSLVGSGSVDTPDGQSFSTTINVSITEPTSNKKLIVDVVDDLGNAATAESGLTFTVDACIIGFLDLVEGSYYNVSSCPGGTPCASVDIELTGSFFGPCGGVDELQLLDGGSLIGSDTDVGDGGATFTVTLNDGADLQLELKASSGGSEVASSGVQARSVDFTLPSLTLEATSVGGFMTPGDGENPVYNGDADASPNDGFQGHVVVVITDDHAQGGQLVSVDADGAPLSPSNVSLPAALTQPSPITSTLNDLTYPAGTSTITLTATDAAGNTGTTSFEVTVDQSAPDPVTLQVITSDDVDPRLPAVTLRWKAVGDNGSGGGAAAAYDVRYSRSPINNLTDFDQACPLSGLPHTAELPVPGAPNSDETYTVSGPDPREQDVLVNGKPCKFAPTVDAQDWHFAVRVQDGAGNWSELGAGSTASTDLVRMQFSNILFSDAFATASGLGPFADFLTVVVRGIGDVNNDGRTDFITGFNFANAACLFLGRDFEETVTVDDLEVSGQHHCVITAQAMLASVLEGGEAASELGSGFEPAGDVNGDGIDDLLLSGKLDDEGFAAIFLGVQDAGPDLTGGPNVLIKGMAKDSGAYVGACGVGNFTGDLNAGNPVGDIGLGEVVDNRIRVLPGNPLWNASTSLVIDVNDPADITSHLMFTIDGDFAGGSAFGRRCQGAGDILPTPGGGVATDDLLVSQTGSSDSRLFLLPGRPVGGPDQVVTVSENLNPPTAEDAQSLRLRQDSIPPEAIKTGFAIGFVGGEDLSGDGVPDVLVANGARGLAEPDTDGKAIFVFDGALLPGQVGGDVRVSALADPIDMSFEGVFGWVLLADANTENGAVKVVGDWDGWTYDGNPTADIIYGHKDFIGGELRVNHETEEGPELLGLFPHVEVSLVNPIEPGAASFGSSFATGGDMTGDGRPDVVSGSGKGQLILIR